MKTVIVTEGDAEWKSIPIVLHRCIHKDNGIKNPVKCDVHPKGNPKHIARKIIDKIDGMGQLTPEVHQIVVLLDKEDIEQCTKMHAKSISDAIRKQLSDKGRQIEIDVVLKLNSYENWLIADPEVFGKYPKRFPNHKKLALATSNRKTDGLDAERIIKDAIGKNKNYDKVSDAKLICKKIDVHRAAQNCESLMYLLRVLKIPSYG